MVTIKQHKETQDTTQLDAVASVDNDAPKSLQIDMGNGTTATITRSEGEQCYIVSFRRKGMKKAYSKRFSFEYVRQLSAEADKLATWTATEARTTSEQREEGKQ